MVQGHHNLHSNGVSRLTRRRAAGLFTYQDPKTQLEKNHNKVVTTLLNVKRS